LEDIWRQLRRNKGAIIGLILIIVIILVARLSPLLLDYDKDVIGQNIKQRLKPPSSAHWFGTDELGRDILSRVIYGARYSLAVGIVAVFVALAFGITLGAAAGYIGGKFENVVMRICDYFFFNSIRIDGRLQWFPRLARVRLNLMLAVGIASTAPFIRVSQSAVLVIHDKNI
jgi:peptide/nickel transport system permease protein